MPYIPPYTGSLIQWVIIGFACSAPLLFLVEATGWFSMGYSKFAVRTQKLALPSKVGMFIVYFPAVLLYPILHFALGAPNTPWHLVCMALCSLHFLKRCLETLFLHRYSGVMNLFTCALICSLYSTASALLGYIASTEVSTTMANSSAFQMMLWPGVALWLVGTSLNFQHHSLLANLRKPGETEYKLPQGGLFRWIACPHYLAELIAWLGYALAFHHIGATVVWATMLCYLAGRAHKTLQWYREKLPQTPAHWRRLIPFVY